MLLGLLPNFFLHSLEKNRKENHEELTATVFLPGVKHIRHISLDIGATYSHIFFFLWNLYILKYKLDLTKMCLKNFTFFQEKTDWFWKFVNPTFFWIYFFPIVWTLMLQQQFLIHLRHYSFCRYLFSFNLLSLKSIFWFENFHRQVLYSFLSCAKK